MINATITSRTSSSKKRRNQKAKNVTAASLAKFASTSRSASVASTASTPSETESGNSPFAFESGSTIRSKEKTAGMSTHASRTTSHQSDSAGTESTA